MDNELKQYLDDGFAKQREEREEAFAKQREETEAGFAKQREDTEAGFAKQREETEAGFAKQREEVRQIETNLLTAFHNWARPMELRQRNASSVVSEFEERVTLVEERLGRLERREGNR